MRQTFTSAIIDNNDERANRFLEESVELCQAMQMSRAKAHRIVDYVFDRPIGEVSQEIAGVGVTLAALANQQSVDLDEAFAIELKRIYANSELIRTKQAAKPKDIAL